MIRDTSNQDVLVGGATVRRAFKRWLLPGALALGLLALGAAGARGAGV